jgi:hypothetical protein
MNKGNKSVFFILALLLMSCLFAGGCGKPRLYSKWSNQDILVDGKFADWQYGLSYYCDSMRLSIGVANDDTYLYMCLITRSRGFAEKFMNSGFTVWFDPQGGSDKKFGIRFPSAKYGEGMPGGKGDDIQGPPRSSFPDIHQESWQEIEIIGPGKEEKYASSIEAVKKDGIDLKIGREKGYFVYELKVPLFENEKHPYYIGAEKNGSIGVGFEIPASGRGMMPGMGMPGRDMPPGGMERPGAGPGPGGGMGMSEDGFSLWTLVVLSSGGAR